ncbi:hypothetical protein U1Q18_029093 [Sarracenia purpurea var. burkii]
MDTLLVLPLSDIGVQPSLGWSASESGGAPPVPADWRTDLTVFMNRDSEKTVFISSTGRTPTGEWKLQSPIETRERERASTKEEPNQTQP